jgi:hypothetical protein
MLLGNWRPPRFLRRVENGAPSCIHPGWYRVPQGRAAPLSSKAKPCTANVQTTGVTLRFRQHPAQQFGLFPMPFGIAGKGRCVQPNSRRRGSRQATHVSSNVDKHNRHSKRMADVGRKAGIEKWAHDGRGAGDPGPLLNKNTRNHQRERCCPRGFGPQQK